jgi:hypothetical protein
MTTATGTGIAEATRRLLKLRKALEAENTRHEKEEARLDREIAAAQDRVDLILTGAPLSVVLIAESVLEVEGRENVGVGRGRAVVKRAIADLANGAPYLRNYYMGTKNYDRWVGQEEGGAYGSRPRHGTQIFSVGLRSEFRAKYLDGSVLKAGRELTEEQVDAAITYLHALLGKESPS